MKNSNLSNSSFLNCEISKDQMNSITGGYMGTITQKGPNCMPHCTSDRGCGEQGCPNLLTANPQEP